MKKIILLLTANLIICTTLFSQVQIGDDINGNLIWGNFGASVRLSADGNILSVGIPENDKGKVRIYQRNSSDGWIQIGSDINGLNIGDYFGWSTDLSTDGNTVAIGAIRRDTDNGVDSGQVLVFQNQGNNWVQIGEPINGDDASDRFGFSISLAANGTIMAIGARANSNKAYLAGHVRIYKYIDNDWIQLGQDIEGDEEWNSFGQSISLSHDGSRIIIGAIELGTNPDTGYVRVFEINSSQVWEQIGPDIKGDNIGDAFGDTVDISSNGEIIAIGALRHNNSSGEVKIYKLSSGNWIQLGDNIEGENNADFFGDSLCLSSDGLVIAIGARNYSSSAGNVSIHKYIQNKWIKIGNDIIGEYPSDFSAMRESLGLSADGSVVAIGAVGNENEIENLYYSGHVRVFELPELPLSNSHVNSETVYYYPNPVNDFLTLNLKNEEDIENIIIYNSLGQKILITQNKKIDLSSVETGIYYLNLSLKNKSKFQLRIVKK